MQIRTYIKVATLITLATCGVAADQAPREIEFTVYGQYPVRNVQYTPIDAMAIKNGEEPPEPIKIKTHTLARMGPYSYKGGDTIHFYDSSGKNLAGRANIPDASEKWLLIFVKNPRHKSNPDKHLRYLIYPFNDSHSNLPKNSVVFLNISGKELDGLLEGKRVSLSAGESDSYRIQESAPINLWTREFDGNELLPALIKTYHFDPEHRYLMIFFPPVLTGSVDLDVRFLAEAVD